MTIAQKTVRFGVTSFILISSIGCDQATKAVARDQLGDGTSHTFFSGIVRFVHAENPGAFLGLGKNLPDSVRLAMLIGGVGLILGVVGTLLYKRLSSETGRMPSLLSLAMGLLLAGGLGNFIDRFVGASTVTDFVQLKLSWASTGVFNVADVFIIVGAAAVALATLQPDEQNPSVGPPSGDSTEPSPPEDASSTVATDLSTTRGMTAVHA